MAGKNCGNMKRDYSNATAFFENGFLYNVFPRNHSISLYDDRDVAYNAKILVSDGKRYNLWKKDDIFSIPIPHFSDRQETTFSLDYILRMIASSFRNNHENYLSICLLLQATKLMPHSNIFWKEEDYLRIVEWLYKDGQISDGDALREYIKTDKLIQSKTNLSECAKNRFISIANRKDLLVFNNYSGDCCSVCAVYSGRVYSISGHDKRYPKLPKFLADCWCHHPFCNTDIAPYWDGDPVMFRGQHIDVSKAMQRPYTDDRTIDEINLYNKRIDICQKKAHDYNRYLDRLREYHLCCSKIPHLMPKSYTAYCRSKRENTESFQKIVVAAKLEGINIDLENQ